MSLMSRELHQVWDALRASKGERDEALVAIRIRKLRGIRDIRIPIRGVLDVLNVELELQHGDIVIGRNSWRDEFPGQVRTLAKFDRLSNFLVLDGDSRKLEEELMPLLSGTREPCTCCSCRATARRSNGCGTP